MPPDRGKPRCEADHLLNGGAFREMFHEAEADPAEALRVKAREFAVTDRQRQERNSAISNRFISERVGNNGIVEAVASRLHDHRAGEAEHGMEGKKLLLRSIRWPEHGIRRKWKTVLRAEDMTMRIACACGKLQRRFSGRGVIGWFWLVLPRHAPAPSLNASGVPGGGITSKALMVIEMRA